MPKTALILGPTGRFGQAMTKALKAAGWSIREFSRARDDIRVAAHQADVIVYGWNPGYQNWEAQARICLQTALQAAERSGATLLFPGNVYVYGDSAPELLSEDTPHAATNPLGKIRIEMEEMTKASKAQVIVLRAGDFLGEGNDGNWFGSVIARKLHKGSIKYPGGPDAMHAFAFLPDYARAFVMLAEKRDTLDKFTTLNFAGYTMTGAQMADYLGVKFGQFNWTIIWCLSFFYLFAHGLMEMRYLWDTPHRLDGARLAAVLPEFQPTPVERGMRLAALLDIDPDEPVIAAAASA